MCFQLLRAGLVQWKGNAQFLRELLAKVSCLAEPLQFISVFGLEGFASAFEMNPVQLILERSKLSVILDPSLRTAEYSEQSDAVSAVVSCFAPTDLPALFEHLKDAPNIKQVMAAYFGTDEAQWPQIMRQWSPALRVEAGKQYPPFLLLHGTGDPLVPCQQMDSLYAALKAAGCQVSAYYVDGAEHEGNFWSPAVRQVIHDGIVHFLFPDHTL